MCFIYKQGYDFLYTRDKVTILLKGWCNLRIEEGIPQQQQQQNLKRKSGWPIPPPKHLWGAKVQQQIREKKKNYPSR